MWQTAKTVDLNILGAKGLIPLRGPMVLFLPLNYSSASPLPIHKVSRIWLHNAWLKHWSLPINFVAWYVLTVVHPDITTVSTRDWQRVYKGSMIKPKINMWCMNFIERQGMVTFKVFLVKRMMHEVLFKICRMPDFFLKKKILGGKSVVSCSPIFFH